MTVFGGHLQCSDELRATWDKRCIDCDHDVRDLRVDPIWLRTLDSNLHWPVWHCRRWAGGGPRRRRRWLRYRWGSRLPRSCCCQILTEENMCDTEWGMRPFPVICAHLPHRTSFKTHYPSPCQASVPPPSTQEPASLNPAFSWESTLHFIASSLTVEWTNLPFLTRYTKESTY